MSAVITATDENYQELTSSGVCLLEFWATWCGPCKMLAPILDQVAQEVGENAVVAKANVEEAQQAAVHFSVRTVPTVFILKDGEIVNQFNSVQSKDTLVNALLNS